jgi:hypothetical protein
MRSDEIGASYTPRPASREGATKGRNFMPLAAIAIAPGIDYLPGFLDRSAQEVLREKVKAILALSPASASPRPARCRLLAKAASPFTASTALSRVLRQCSLKAAGSI